MRMKMIYLPIIAIVLFSIFSCTGGNNSKQPSDANPMKPTDEYNYLLLPATWNEWASNIRTALGEEPSKPVDSADVLEKVGLGEPEIKGLSDGEKILLEATYPVLGKEKDYEKILSRLPGGKMGFPGRIPTDNLILYLKSPGVEGLTDAVHDVFENLTEKGENPFGKRNPVTVAMGSLMVMQIDYKEDIFSWMGPEMGLVMYRAIAPDKSEYANTAFVMSIEDKEKASEKIAKLLKIAQGTLRLDKSKELLSRESYKTFIIDTFDVPAGFASSYLIPNWIIPSDREFKAGILYTDDYLFVSDLHGLEQLADMYDPGGAQVEEANFADFIDIDDFILLTSLNRESAVNDIRESLKESPEQLAKFDEYYGHFQNMIKEKKIGRVKLILKFQESNLQLKLELTKSTIDLVNFLSEWLFETAKASNEIVETKTGEGV